MLELLHCLLRCGKVGKALCLCLGVVLLVVVVQLEVRLAVWPSLIGYIFEMPLLAGQW